MSFPPVYPSPFAMIKARLNPSNSIVAGQVSIQQLSGGGYTIGYRFDEVEVHKASIREWFNLTGFEPPAETDYVGDHNEMLTVFDFNDPAELTLFKLHFGIA